MNHPTVGEKQAWSSVLEKIKTKIASEQFTTWFTNLRLIELNNHEIHICVSNLFCKEWLKNNYMDIISSTINEVTNLDPNVILVAENEENISKPEPFIRDTPTLINDKEHIYVNKNYTFENFLVGPCNRLAHAAALAVCESPGVTYNPLFIHGPVGLGKTHLLQAIHFQVQHHSSQYRVSFLPCEAFVNHYISTIKNGNWDDFRNMYRKIDVLLIDDVHFLANSQSSREEFFHTFNALYSQQKQIVLSSDCPPEEIPTIEERLISRFRWGLIARVDQPSLETSIAIIQKKASLLDMNLSYETAYYLAENIPSNIREIEGSLINIKKHAFLLGKTKIDLALAKHVVHESLKKERKYIGIEDILHTVTKHFGVQLSQLHSKRKFKSITLPRQVAMHLARKLTRLSLEEIGGYMGGRDHTTVMHADEKIKNLKRVDRNVSATLRKMEKELIK
ncbi:MAG: chromosomal replication initiator protein DnaA [Candidatus Scalindua sp.]